MTRIYSGFHYDELRRRLEASLETGTVTSATSNTLTDTSKSWATDIWKGRYVEITGGTGAGQIRLILSNTSDTLTLSASWAVVPDSTSTYRIFGGPISDVSIQSGTGPVIAKISGETVELASGTGPALAAQFGTWVAKISGETVAIASGNVTIIGSTIQLPTDVQSVLANKYAVASGYLLSGPSVELDTEGLKLLEIYGLSHASGMATQWRLDVSPDDSLWITDYATYASGTEVKDTLWCGFRYVRLRADPAGASGNTAVLVLSAKP